MLLGSLTGILDYLAGPGVGLSVLTPFVFLPFLLAIRSANTLRAALAVGATSGTSAFLCALWSLPIALQRARDLSVGASWVVLLIVLLIQAIPLGVGAGTYYFCRKHLPRLSPLLGAPLCLTIAEVLLPTPIGYSHGALWLDTPIAPLVTLGGRAFGAFAVFFSATVLYERAVRSDWKSTVGIGVAVSTLTIFPSPELASGKHSVLRVLVVDANAPPSAKRHSPKSLMDKHIQLTRNALGPGHAPVDLVVWGESILSLPRSFERQVALARKASDRAPILAGALIRAESSSSITNSLILTSHCGESCRYDKKKLVPLTEGSLGSWIDQWLSLDKHSPVLAGSGENVMRLGNNSIGVALCFEGMYADRVRAAAAAGAQALINPVSDDWLIDPTMRRYHEALARFAALEQGIPLLRVSNRGRTIVQSSSGNLLFSEDPTPDKAQVTRVWLPLVSTS